MNYWTALGKNWTPLFFVKREIHSIFGRRTFEAELSKDGSESRFMRNHGNERRSFSVMKIIGESGNFMDLSVKVKFLGI